MCFSTFIQNKPSFFSGMMRIFDLGATFSHYGSEKNPEELDKKAIYSDFCAVDEDLRKFVENFEER